MEIQPKVSVIVPIYKVEKYLRRCMDSLINQTLDDVEIICVNDGSPDNCLNILKEYKEKYKNKNIVIIDKKNEGLFKARVSGTIIAKGKYIAYIDSDDYAELDWLESLYNKAIEENADVVVCGFNRTDEDTKKIYSTEMVNFGNTIIDMDKNPELLISVNPAAWNKLYKTEIVKGIDLNEVPPIFEDLALLQIASLKAKKIVFTNKASYNYMVRKDSMIQTVKEEQIRPTLKTMIGIRKAYQEDKNGKKRLEILDSMAFLHFGISLMFRMSYDKKNFGRVLKENREVLDKEFPNWRKTKYLKLWYCISHKGENLKVAVMKKIYFLHLFKAFLACYKWILKTFKVDIKW